MESSCEMLSVSTNMHSIDLVPEIVLEKVRIFRKQKTFAWLNQFRVISVNIDNYWKRLFVPTPDKKVRVFFKSFNNVFIYSDMVKSDVSCHVSFVLCRCKESLKKIEIFRVSDCWAIIYAWVGISVTLYNIKHSLALLQNVKFYIVFFRFKTDI